MKKVGIITYHAAYNFGSELQAYALCQTLLDNGYSANIINYRPDAQKAYYALYRTKCGIKNFAKDFLRIPYHVQRKKRQDRFESFISAYLKPVGEYSMLEDTKDFYDLYDTIISGSDQVWNKRSWELRYVDWKYMDPYLLVGFGGKKVSYASSFGSMKEDEIRSILPKIEDFDYVSFREKSSIDLFSRLSNMEVSMVLDPTLLLSKDQWIRKLDLKEKKNEPYILYYSLAGYNEQLKRRENVIRFAKDRKARIRVVSPACDISYPKECADIMRDYGPIEFLEALYNAECVVTDSYHGTILAINFHKEFVSFCGKGGSEHRKRDVLNLLGLSDRAVEEPDELQNLKMSEIDYAEVSTILEEKRSDSLEYLKEALGEQVE